MKCTIYPSLRRRRIASRVFIFVLMNLVIKYAGSRLPIIASASSGPSSRRSLWSRRSRTTTLRQASFFCSLLVPSIAPLYFGSTRKTASKMALGRWPSLLFSFLVYVLRLRLLFLFFDDLPTSESLLYVPVEDESVPVARLRFFAVLLISSDDELLSVSERVSNKYNKKTHFKLIMET